MQPTLCSRCGKNVAIIFITKIENGQTKNEGLCLKCARELHIKPVDDVINKMGISDDDLDNISGDMMNAMNGVEELMTMDGADSDADDDGKTATYGFEMLNELEHAWVMTVHKSQGSEYRAVVLCIGRAGPMLLTRSVLYTAITRAKSLLIIVGDEGAAYHMIDNQTQTRRYSGLRARLCGECGAI